MSEETLRRRASQHINKGSQRNTETPPPPYEGDDDDSSPESEDEQPAATHPAVSLPTTTSTISMVKSRLAKKKSLQLLRRVSSVSQEMASNDGSHQIDQMEAAMKAITDTQTKLAEMVAELKEIALATTGGKERARAVEDSPALKRAPSVRRKKATSNLNLTHMPSISSKLSTVIEAPLSNGNSSTQSPTNSSTTGVGGGGGSVFHDPDDTKRTPSHIQRRISSYNLNLQKSNPTINNTLRRHSSFVSSPKYPTPESLLVPLNEHQEDEDPESYDRVKNLIESLLLQASEALETNIESTVDESHSTLSKTDDLIESDGSLETKNSQSTSYTQWLESYGNDHEWSRQVVVSAVPLLCAAAEQELLRTGDNFEDEEDDEDFVETNASAIRVVQNVLGTLLSMLVVAQKKTIHSNHIGVNSLPVTYISPALVMDSNHDGGVDAFMRKLPRNRLRRISFDSAGNEIERDELPEKSSSRGNSNQLQLNVVVSVSPNGFLDTLTTVMSLQFSLLYILTFSAWMAARKTVLGSAIGTDLHFGDVPQSIRSHSRKRKS
ncbi:hypothetical protein BDR26DRAFT_1007844, partial [Obelidium mucronatum]